MKEEGETYTQGSFDWGDEDSWGEADEPLTCGVENPEVCESCT